MRIYIDVDSGTVLNGPIYAVDSAFLSEDGSNDEDNRLVARLYGEQVD